MTEQKQCAQCGVNVTPDALWGLCHKCLYDQATAQPVTEGGISSLAAKHFGSYELGTLLGRGGMGVVYEAMHIGLRKPVALKMILDSHADSPLAHRRFRMEAESAARLDHPNIVPIYDIGEHEGCLFLTMKLIAGQTLLDLIRSGDLCLMPRTNETSRTDLRQRMITIVQLVATVARAVDHAHQKKVVHRDLKPSNILVDAAGQPHITDFGLAKMLQPDGEPGAGPASGDSGTVGTPNYMSPEQANGRRITPASDIYSLGAILYEMLTGKPPFKGATVLETLRLVCEQPAMPPALRNPRVDADLNTICLKCLEKNPDARYPSALALAEDLDRWLRQEPIRARPVSKPERVRRWMKRNPAPTALILTLLVGLTAAVSLLHLAREQQKRIDLINAHNQQMFNVEIERLWKNTNETFVHLHSSRLAQLASLDLRPLAPDTVQLTYGAVIHADPLGQAVHYAPLLRKLEERMEKFGGYPVAIDLRLYKFDGDGGQAPVALGQVDFQRLGPLRYVQARQAHTNLHLVASENLPKEGVIFARKTLGISNLNQVVGLRVAFASTNSTISFLTKVALARARLTARDLACTSNLTYRAWASALHATDDLPGMEGDNDSHAHREVLRQVLAGDFDVGEGARPHFERNKHRKRGLVELASFPVIPDVMAARPGLSEDTVAVFLKALLSLSNREEFRLVERVKSDLRGYLPAKDSDYDGLRVMMRDADRFDFPSESAATNAHGNNIALE